MESLQGRNCKVEIPLKRLDITEINIIFLIEAAQIAQPVQMWWEVNLYQSDSGINVTQAEEDTVIAQRWEQERLYTVHNIKYFCQGITMFKNSQDRTAI